MVWVAVGGGGGAGGPAAAAHRDSLPPSLPLTHSLTHSQVAELPLPTATPAASIFSAAARHVTATHWKRMTMDEVRERERERETGRDWKRMRYVGAYEYV